MYALSQAFAELFEHVCCHAVEVEGGIPIPFSAGAAVVETVGPAGGDALLQGIYFIDHFEVGAMATYGSINLTGLERHGGNVEAIAVDEAGRVGFHELHARLKRIGIYIMSIYVPAAMGHTKRSPRTAA